MAGIKIDGPVSEAVGMINARIQELARSGDEREQARRDGMVEAVALILIALAAPHQPAGTNGYTPASHV